MAIVNWLDVQPTSGNGNRTVNVTAKTSNTGRNARSVTLKWKGKAGGVDEVHRVVNQAGKANYVDIDDTAASKKEGQDVTIKGSSNSAKLTFSLEDGSLPVTLPSTYTANSLTTNNGAAISGDPGQAAEYEFSITVSVGENKGLTELTRRIIVTNEAGMSDVCTLTLAAGAPFITVTVGDIELGWEEGSSASVEVTSNTDWEIY